MLSFEEEEDLAWAKELLPTFSLEGRPAATRRQNSLLPALALARNTSRTCSACLGGRRCLPCSAGSPPARSPRPPRGLTRTRLCWQRKKHGKPRPVKMGDILRSAYAQRLVNQHQVIPRSKVLRMHQWSISLPGACEGLCHWRGTTEPMVANGTLEPLVAADLDLSRRVACIRQALRTHFPEASAWTEWQHQAESVTFLTTGAAFATNRETEQGDVLDTIGSALVLGQARHASWPDHLQHPRGQASAMNGSWTTGKCLFDPSSSTHCFVPWTPPSPLLVPPEGVPRATTSRAPSACFAHQSAGRS